MRIRSLSPARRALLLGSLLSVSLHAFDELSVLTALPVIADELAGRALYGAVFYAYLLASILGLVGAGWLATRFGPARPFAAGLALFLVGLGTAAAAPTMLALVLSRALQGLGGGVISTVVLIVVNRAFSEQERPRVMALNSAAWVIPALIAPGIAGMVAEQLGWRWIFAGLAPLVLLAGALALPAMRHLGPGMPGPRAARQLADGVRLALGVGLLLAGLDQAVRPAGIALLGVGALLSFAPLRRILPRGLFLSRDALAGAVGFKLLLVFAFFGAEAFLPLALREVHGRAASVAGLMLSAAALAWTSGAFVYSRLAARREPRVFASCGAGLVFGGIAALLVLLDPAAPLWIGFVGWASAGLGMGLAYNVAVVTAMEHTPAGSEGFTSTALGVADALAISVATGLGGAVLVLADRGGWSGAEALLLTWQGMAVVAALALVVAFRRSLAAQIQPA